MAAGSEAGHAKLHDVRGYVGACFDWALGLLGVADRAGVGRIKVAHNGDIMVRKGGTEGGRVVVMDE